MNGHVTGGLSVWAPLFPGICGFLQMEGPPLARACVPLPLQGIDSDNVVSSRGFVCGGKVGMAFL